MRNLVLAIFLITSLKVINAQGFECSIEITQLRSNKGKCILCLYKNSNGFPTNPQNAIAFSSSFIKDNKVNASFKNLEPGFYAVSVLHDENNNGVLDTNFLGIPTEGIGTSNNAKSLFGPPSFEDSKFSINNKTNPIKITIKYL